jgi:hypothetical protein
MIKKFIVHVTTDDPRYQNEPQLVEYFGVDKRSATRMLKERFGSKAVIKILVAIPLREHGKRPTSEDE